MMSKHPGLGVVLLIGSIFFLFGCQETRESPSSEIELLYKEYELQPSTEKAEIYLDSLSSFIRANIEHTQFIKPHLVRGVQVSIAQGQLSRTSNYLLPLLRLYPDLEDRNGYLLSLGEVMHTLRKRHASSVIFKELVSRNPDDQKIIDRSILIDSAALVETDYVEYLFQQILIDPDEYGVNRNASLVYVDATEALALVSPERSDVPGHLYRAAEVARSMRTFPKAMSLYDWLIKDYPDHEKTPTAMFIKGFILEQDYDLIDEAREVYTEFLIKFPEHEMAESAQFLLNNLGKSDEEILQSIESNRVNSNN